MSSVDNSGLPTLEDLIIEYIQYLLTITCYNVTQTAKILNVSRATIYNKHRHLGE